ncbi:MAG: YecA family protein [Neisseria sp.]|nr:YecA family protein [Neisseria sp.]
MAFDANHLEELRALLDQHAADGDTMRCDEVQAFVTAMISGPDVFHLEQWLPEIMAYNEHYSEADVARIGQLIAAWTEDLQRDLDADLPFTLLLYPDEQGQPDYMTWCNAYLFALESTETDWFAAAHEDIEELLYPIAALGGLWDDEDDVYLSDEEAQQLRQDLPQTLHHIYRYWQIAGARREPVRHAAPPVGRNEPCPCGSGKKYKQCCLSQA